MKIKKENLLIVAGVIWGIAGTNILRIGISSFVQSFDGKRPWVFFGMMLISAIILLGFTLMFRKVVMRNTRRILSYPDKKSVFAFFDAKGYLLMLFMMGLGITLRSVNLLPHRIFCSVLYGAWHSALAGGCVLYQKLYPRAEQEEAVG